MIEENDKTNVGEAYKPGSIYKDYVDYKESREIEEDEDTQDLEEESADPDMDLSLLNEEEGIDDGELSKSNDDAETLKLLNEDDDAFESFLEEEDSNGPTAQKLNVDNDESLENEDGKIVSEEEEIDDEMGADN